MGIIKTIQSWGQRGTGKVEGVCEREKKGVQRECERESCKE